MGLIVALAANHRLPAIYPSRSFVGYGGLMSYAPVLPGLSAQAASYVDLKGAKPAELPMEQPTIYELVVNLRTAKALALTIPDAILLRADAVIQ